MEYLIVRALFQVEHDQTHYYEEEELADFEILLMDFINANRLSISRSDIIRGERVLITLYYNFE